MKTHNDIRSQLCFCAVVLVLLTIFAWQVPGDAVVAGVSSIFEFQTNTLEGLGLPNPLVFSRYEKWHRDSMPGRQTLVPS